MKLKKIFTITTIILFLFLFAQKVDAEVVATNYIVDVEIDQNYNAEVTYEIDLVNQTDEILSGYELVVPFSEIKNTVAKLAGKKVSVKAEGEGGYTELDINFKRNSLLDRQKKTLKITFSTSKVVKEENGLKLFYFPKIDSNHKISKSNLLISFHQSLGEPTFTTADLNNLMLNNETYEIILNDQKAMMIVWGNFYNLDLQSRFRVSNSADGEDSLVNLISQSGNQKVVYKEISGVNSGAYDNLGNSFAIIDWNDEEPGREISFSARVEKSVNQLTMKTRNLYNWKFVLRSTLGQRLSAEMSKGQNTKEKLSFVNYFLSEDLNVSTMNNLSTSSPDLWSKYDENELYDRFELCKILIAIAEDLGIRGEIKYGYVTLLRSSSFEKQMPHIWSQFSVDGEVFIADPFLQNLTGFNYFGSNGFDRIEMGTWHPKQEYNNMLGLLSNREKQRISFVENFDNFVNKDQDVSLILDFPSKAYSGEFYDAKLKINNQTNYFIPISRVFINEEDVHQSVQLSEHIYPALLPNVENTVEVNYLREANFLFDGVKEVNVDVRLDNDRFERLTSKAQIEFLVDERLFAVVVVGGVLGMLFLILVGRRLRRKFNR